MNTYITLLVAVIVAYALLRRFDLYTPLSTSRTLFLDNNWNATLNNPKRVGEPFNTCSPEDFGGCAKLAFPNLSRY